ncbi:MAG: hypothetical protein DCF22_09330 [Leptolyngbya sp.]|nr:MAG: hypothetical protein DCF22_09330 [Leptolyngbya sp.]
MQVVVCPGVHEPQLTASFIEGLGHVMDFNRLQWLVFPTDRYLAYSGLDILQWMQKHLSRTDLKSPIAIIAFSAGVVGAIAAAQGWQAIGGTIQVFIALDGWGVPLWGNFPIHRLSHDHFTHWSSALLGAGESSFYAEPAVEHLELWRSPHRVQGWQQPVNAQPSRATAAFFIATLLHRYNLESDFSSPL